MTTDLINIGLAFLEGLALIVSPCILPILPIILSGSLTGSKSRPLGIVSGLIISFTIFTLFSRTLVEHAHINPDSIRNASFVLLLLLGIMMMSTFLTEKFNILSQRLTRVGSSIETVNNPESGFSGGLLFGFLIGIIWTPCAGPILAAVIVQTIIQHTTLSSVLTVIAFAVGAGIPMLLIALFGRRILNRFSILRDMTSFFRKLLGFIIVVTVLCLIFTSGTAPTFSQNSGSHHTTTTNATRLINGLEQPIVAPEFAGIDAWINSAPLTLNALKGKVVLIDFWTYSCINCVRTLPYIKDWYTKYHDKGLVIIGVHSPEFQFEHDINNVKNAVISDEIHYPVAIDNEFMTWQLFKNEYWPAHYLINKNGEIVYEHFGEGDYDVTENNIRYLLGLTGSSTESVIDENYSASQTPETYLGYNRATLETSPTQIVKDQIADYHYPTLLSENNWALSGKWKISSDKITAESTGASIKLHFRAGKVYAVMGAPQSITLKLQMENTKNKNAGINTELKVQANKLYTLLEFKKETDGIVEIISNSPGLEIYTFTFGSSTPSNSINTK